MKHFGRVFCAIVGAANCTFAIDLDVNDPSSIKSAASTIAHGLMSYYTGNVTDTPETLGVLPPPYYWWESGAMWGALMDYYYFTNDSSYNKVLTQGLLSQVGPRQDYMVPRHQKDEGNDDQAFWGFAVMSAAEKGYPQPDTGDYTWVELVERLWNTQVARWDTQSCGGGLRWQIFSFNNGYTYKNTVSNGAFFQLSARLARFTGNQTYVDWAEKVYNWTVDINLMTEDYHVYDGTDLLKNCSDQDKITWTYNGGIYLYGAAMMYNYTNGSSLWQQRTEGLFNATAYFFNAYKNATDIMYEPSCETINTCATDQYSFKGFLSRFMWATTLIAPFTQAAIAKFLTASSKAAATSCSGSDDGVTCGVKWYVGGYDGNFGAGQQMSALETIQGLFIAGTEPPIHQRSVHLQSAPTISTAAVPSSIATATSTAKKKSHSDVNYHRPSLSAWTCIIFCAHLPHLFY